jgi:hypothetical protein
VQQHIFDPAPCVQVVDESGQCVGDAMPELQLEVGGRGARFEFAAAF